MKSTIILFAGLCLLSSGAAQADESTPLIELCKQYDALPPPGDTVTAEYIQLKSSCAGFLGSTVRMSRPDDGICRPDRFNIDELTKVYLAWANKNPDKWNLPTKETIIEAMKDIYPCPK